eukprot:TRINITY_DN8091_c0_g3_i1.p1 TRINITY_DN8091_c0_g3~~TRINITY_DN8091_c0_g3_i1.p1  ORF type:complete len:611 (-),score=87.52 TRINITY_DN8091_c0_g3_i1:367-2145(-)
MLAVIPGGVQDEDGALCPGAMEASPPRERQVFIDSTRLHVKPAPVSEDSNSRRPSQQSTASPPLCQGHFDDSSSEAHHFSGSSSSASPAASLMETVLSTLQKYAIPLLSGILIAVLWANLHYESYHAVIDEPIVTGAEVLGHPLTLHFLVNDVFMCFFFGLAIKEVTEALLPGGALNPIKRAMNPLFATVGGILGPVVVYLLFVRLFYSAGVFDDANCDFAAGNGHRRLTDSTSSPCELNTFLAGWGVPTATDISLAWMGAVLIFKPGHAAINFLLLLAILDDALGMVIIAVFYPDPLHPVEPAWLGMLAGASALAITMRILQVQSWPVYVGVCGPIAWVSLLKAHVHPALALVFVVPFMPATHAIHEEGGVAANLGACDFGAAATPAVAMIAVEEDAAYGHRMSVRVGALGAAVQQTSRNLQQQLHLYDFNNAEAHAPLHQFESQAKRPVDFGMFFFGLANAGVKLGSVGGITFSVLGALMIGKVIGITLMSMLARALGFGLPPGVNLGDILTMSALASIGLTVALFVASEAFPQPALQGEAKMGAMLSIGGFGLAICMRKLTHLCWPPASDAREAVGRKDNDAVVVIAGP